MRTFQDLLNSALVTDHLVHVLGTLPHRVILYATPQLTGVHIKRLTANSDIGTRELGGKGRKGTLGIEP